MGALLAEWTVSTFVSNGFTYPTYRRGHGPGVIVMHEMPGLTPAVIGFGEKVVAAGFTVVMPLLFGEAERPVSSKYVGSSVAKGCIAKEFTALVAGRTPPIAAWLRALARTLHEELGGPGVGAIGMCWTGGFALAMMVDAHTVAPVISQPSLPILPTRRQRADLNLSPADLAAVKSRDCDVMGLQFTGDKLVGDRFATLRAELGDRFIAVEFPSSKPTDHSVLTEQVQDVGVARVLEFLHQRLD